MDIGFVWRVGNDKSIDVWHDKWIFKHPNFCPSLPKSQQPTPMKVAQLIENESRSWNEKMLQEMFHPDVTSMILNIHLSRLSEPDKLIWYD